MLLNPDVGPSVGESAGGSAAIVDKREGSAGVKTGIVGVLVSLVSKASY